MAIKISEIIESKFGNKIDTTTLYDIVDVRGHQQFKIKFQAYDYFVIIFSYDLDIIGCSIVQGHDNYISLVTGKNTYSDTNFDVYFEKIKHELELRIPDKFLSARGWL
jgi:hypothetical protein